MSLVEPEAHYSPTRDNLSVSYLKGNSNIKYDKTQINIDIINAV